MMEKFLGEYDLKARVAPGLILALPILVDTFYAAPLISALPIFAGGGICSFALVYGLGYLAGTRGNAIEPELWKQWGCPPSTRFLRHRDSSFTSDLKASIRAALTQRFSLVLPRRKKKDESRGELIGPYSMLSGRSASTCVNAIRRVFGTSTISSTVSRAIFLGAATYGC